jgi:hypothetical protein
MATEGKFIEEIAKQLPLKQAYEDIAHPGAKQAGQVIEDLVKVLHLALAPVQMVAALQDRFRRFVDEAIRRVPEDRRVAPPPQILGPVLEGVRYESEGTPIDELFSQLLSRGMDQERVAEAHPAFPIIIKQLSSDEAIILAALDGIDYDFVYTLPLDRETNLFGPRRIEIDTLPRDDLLFPDNVPFYLEHLDQLGLAKILQQAGEPLYGNTAYVRGVPASVSQTGSRIRCKYTLTDFGKRFVLACRPAPTKAG